MIDSFSIGLTALRAAQIGLDVTGNNIANANTVGYHRQIPTFVNRVPIRSEGFEFGTGVELNDIRRMHSWILEQTARENVFARGDVSARLELSRRFETVFASGSDTLPARLNNFFSQLESLSVRPDDASARQSVIQTAVNVTSTLRSRASDLDRIAKEIDVEVETVVSHVNKLAQQITDLNGQIRRAKATQSQQPNDLLDRRDALVVELSQFVDVDMDYDHDIVYLADRTMVLGNRDPKQLVMQREANGISIRISGSDKLVKFAGGRLKGLQTVRNEIIPVLQGRLKDIAGGMIQLLDPQHVQGIGADGGFRRLTSGRPAADATVPLSQLETVLPLERGTLYVSILDQSSGEVTLQQVALDPYQDTLQTVAAKLSGLDHLQAVTNDTTGELSLLAEPGYTFDFTGSIATRPDTSSLTGTAEPKLYGRFDGDENGELTFSFSGSGEVGVADDLQVEVRDATGLLVTTVNVGAGYEPGTAVDLGNGVSFEISHGTLVSGESFSAPVVADSDESGVLTALGLNSFFVGDDPHNLAVNPRLVENPDALATAKSPQPGDVRNLSSLIARRDLPVLVDNTQTVEQFVGRLISDVGSQVQTLDQTEQNLELLQQSIAGQQANISGVDPNEEAIHMLQYQQAFQAAARYLDVVNQTTQELFRILG